MTANSGIVVWNKTAASNATADSAQNWAEDMAPSAINDSARGGMASMAKWRDDNSGSLQTAGSSTAYTLTTNQNFAGKDSSFVADYTVAFQIDEDCGTPVTLNVDSLGAKPLRSAAGVELVAGALKAGGIYSATYKTSNSGEWILQNVTPTLLADGQVATAKIADGAVTYAKMQDVSATSRILGRKTSGAGDPEEITGSDALDFVGSTRGNVLVRGASTWGVVGPGTQGQVLRSDGTDVGFGVIPLLHVVEEQNNNTGSSANLTTGAWSTCALNTTRTNEISSASLSSNQVSLPAGTYHASVRVASPQNGGTGNTFKVRLRDVTASATLLLSPTMGWTGGGSAGGTPTIIAEGRFTLGGTKLIEVQIYQNTGSSGTNILGGNKGTGYSEKEIYTELLIWRVT